MEQILSQDEIDALLKGISDGDIETEKEPEVAGEEIQASSFDFIRYSKSKKERLPALDFIYDRFSKSLRSSLSLFLEKEVEINVEPLDYLPYEDFVKTLPLPTNLNIVVTENLKGFFIVIFDAKMIFAVLETVFGAANITNPRVEGREFTRIEFTVIRKLIDLVSAEMEKAWTPVYEIRCKYSRSEINPNYITMISKEEVVCLCQFTFEIGDMTSWMKVCIPYGILEGIKGSLISTPNREDQEMRDKWFVQLNKRVRAVPLDVRAVLGRKRLSLQEFIRVQEDNIIMVDRYMNDTVDLEVGGKVRFRGKLGAYKGNKAVQVEEVVR